MPFSGCSIMLFLLTKFIQLVGCLFVGISFEQCTPSSWVLGVDVFFWN